jgi:Tfp pilus assembly PilM family ATPase
MKLEFKLRKRKKLSSVLGLVLDAGKLDGVVLRRTNGALQKLQSFSAPITLDPLTAAPELVGREIRNQLDAAGVRERDCVVGVPLKWVLTAQTELPPLPEADAASLLQLEAEKGFHADTATLQIANARSALAGGKKYVLLAGIPGSHIAALEQVLAAAKLRPASLALGICALQSDRGPETHGPDAHATTGVLALAIGESSVGLQVTAGGGVTALRALEGAIENEGSRRTLHADVVAREARVTIGQLPDELRDQVKQIRIFGPRELAQQLADELELRFEPMGMKVDIVSAYAPNEFGVTLPPEASPSPAFSLAARVLTERNPPFEFLPPKPTLVEQLVTKYSSGRLRTTGAVAAGVAVLVLGAFLFQEIQLLRLRAQWSHIQAKVTDLQKIQDQIQQYQPWYPGDYRSLAILRELSLAFPQSGEVTAKLVSIREDGTVNCSGNTQDNAALLTMQSALSKLPGVTDVHYESGRGNKPPLQFVFSFKYHGGAQ